MKKTPFLLFLLLLTLRIPAQQEVQYSQYMLNGLGLNPAYAGEKEELEIMMGRRVQWTGFNNGPEANFVSFSKSIGKKGFYSGWHGVGAYVEEDKTGMFTSKAAYLTYAYHLKLAKNYIFSAGISAGARFYSLDNALYNASDPALSNNAISVFIWPDITPGLRLSSKKGFIDLSAKQILDNKLANGSQEIGTSSRLVPHFFLTFGRKFESSNYAWTITPSMQIHSSITYLPAADANVLVFYHNIVGVGFSYRVGDAAVAMLQFRLMRKILIGLSYDYSLSRFAPAAANSQEIMFGFSPYALPEHQPGGTRVAQCPAFDY
jgi:type IX secretion system PorP/SprF family membrane protein